MAVVLKTLAQGTVTTAGTKVRLVADPISNAIKAWVTAPAANGGSIYIGDAAVAATRGIEIPKGSTLVLDAPQNELLDLREIWVDAATSGDDFQVTYLTKIS